MPLSKSNNITFEDQAELVGYALGDKSVAPGEELDLTLYWRERAPNQRRFFSLHPLVRCQWKFGWAVGCISGGGLYPSAFGSVARSSWITFACPVSLAARGPFVARVEAGLYRRSSLKNLEARDPRDQNITPTLARFKVEGTEIVEIQNPSTLISQIGWHWLAMPSRTRRTGCT